jgi:hypothetical protein
MLLKVATMLGVVGCSSVATTDADVALQVGVTTVSDGVSLIGSGYVCEDDLEISASVDSEVRVITLAGRGSIPDNEFDYCSRYIDTGGEGVSETERRLTLALEPGTYTLRNADASDQIEFDYHNGVVTSSDPYPTLSLQRERKPGRDTTIAVANQLFEGWNLPEDSEVLCGLDDQLDTATEQYFTSCVVFTPGFTTDVGQHPVPIDALEGLGCTLPTETDLADNHGGWELTCDLVGGDLASTLHIRGSHSTTGRDGLAPGWFWAWRFFVWTS